MSLRIDAVAQFAQIFAGGSDVDIDNALDLVVVDFGWRSRVFTS